jgi:hypothetical protein
MLHFSVICMFLIIIYLLLPPMQNHQVHKKQVPREKVLFYCVWNKGLENIFTILQGTSILIFS